MDRFRYHSGRILAPFCYIWVASWDLFGSIFVPCILILRDFSITYVLVSFFLQVPSPKVSAAPNFWNHFYNALTRSARFAHEPCLLRSFQIRFGFVALSGLSFRAFIFFRVFAWGCVVVFPLRCIVGTFVLSFSFVVNGVCMG